MCTVLATLLRRLLIALIVMVEYFSDPSYMKTAITRGAFAIWLRSWSEAVISRREGKKGEELPSAVCLQTGSAGRTIQSFALIRKNTNSLVDYSREAVLPAPLSIAEVCLHAQVNFVNVKQQDLGLPWRGREG
jgi:hypothetical protein